MESKITFEENCERILVEEELSACESKVGCNNLTPGNYKHKQWLLLMLQNSKFPLNLVLKRLQQVLMYPDIFLCESSLLAIFILAELQSS